MRIVKSGIAAIQDLGRTGFRNLGITRGGVMDNTSARLCNMLVANDADEALIEITGGELVAVAESSRLITVGGRGYGVSLADKPIATWQPFLLKEGDAVRIRPNGSGIAYLAIHGGFKMPRILGSRSTHLSAAFGGHEGRLLKAGDLLPTAVLKSETAEKIVRYLSKTSTQSHLRLSHNVIPDHTKNIIRFIAGPEYELFTPTAKMLIQSELFELTGMRSRMGFRFSGAALQLSDKKELLSSAVVPGSMQVSPDGQLLVLMADAQTAGGYPRIGQVIAVDLPLLAQQATGARIGFSEVSVEEAERLYLLREQQLHQLEKDYTLFFT